ncbi:hypothetical protein GCM10018779_58990 [Streptomyces griseocarneus]|nr:hypothetical protein GCM10018779_58990 [Streptomyces griseocarneus]
MKRVQLADVEREFSGSCLPVGGYGPYPEHEVKGGGLGERNGQDTEADPGREE